MLVWQKITLVAQKQCWFGKQLVNTMLGKKEKTIRATGWRTLFDGSDLNKWSVGGDEETLVGDALTIAKGEVRAETGGMSWDNYVLRADIMVTPKGGIPKYCVQLTANGTCVYCQLVPHCMLIAYYCEKPRRNPEGFTHLIAPVAIRIPERSWFTFTMRASDGEVTGMINGAEIANAQIPSGTKGMPGFLVNQLERCVVKVRNIKVRLLRPTKKQLGEFHKHPLYNWLKHVEATR